MMKKITALQVIIYLVIFAGIISILSVLLFLTMPELKSLAHRIDQVDKIKTIENNYYHRDSLIIEREHFNYSDTIILKYFYQRDTLIRENIKETNYYYRDSLVKIKYLDGQVVFPVSTFVLIGYDIDSFNEQGLMGLRDQIDSIFNIKY